MAICYRYRDDDGVILFAELNHGHIHTSYIRDESINNYGNKLKIIYEYINEYGIRFFGDPTLFELTQENKEEFIRKVHEGFSLAQEIIIEELVSIESETQKIKLELKQANKNRDIKLKNNLNNQIEDLSIRSNVFRKLADSIAWYFLQHHYIANRFYLKGNMPSINNSNLESGRKFVREFNKNEMGFALLTDITSFLQIGDVLCIEFEDERIKQSIIELKEGEKNRKLLEMLEDPNNNFENTYTSLEPKSQKQMKRIIKQGCRGERAISVINNEEGIDSEGTSVKICDVTNLDVEFYTETVRSLLKDCETDGWALDTIEDECLFVAAYHLNIPIKKAYQAFTGWLEDCAVNYPVTNFQSSFNFPLAYPPFINGIDKSDVIDLSLGKKIILSCLNLDRWFDLGETMDLKCEWMSRKDSDKIIKKDKRILYHNNRVAKASLGSNSAVLGNGIPQRIFFDFLTPLCALKLLKTSLSQTPSSVE